ncbi:DUF3817 domain-containing protein [Mesobacillus subterraneus]|uniref:DUF3817 domain-containing protein n=1 Tax=Mesobacillus subterraneus TaxID=285983 RepID=UPI001CFC79C8|nr:DUF3817 domain-containing protein [Mesobacillus subterraneus]WLR57457.1 DUF3817 domain-containing protein [Mesobacillus subterraneus]
MQNTAISRFLMMGLIEGGSLLVLVFIAMPLKYWAGFPEAVRFVGSLHGFLFVFYVLMIIYTTFKIRWSLLWAVSGLAAAFIPFGHMVLDRFLQQTFSVKEVS